MSVMALGTNGELVQGKDTVKRKEGGGEYVL